jgi:zinc protease
VLATLAIAPARAATASTLGAVHRVVQGNGLTVLVAEEPGAPLVTVAVAYKVGARNETAGTTGLAHYAEHMTFRGTRKFPGHELADSITRLGGRTSAYTWIDQTYYASTLERFGLDHLLDVEAERMSAATFDPEGFRRERTSVLAELRSYDDPQSLLYDAVLAASFEVHPYRNNTIGWLSDVEALTRDDAYAFYRRYYQPNNAVLVVAGDVRTEEVLARVRALFGPLPGSGESTAVRALEPPPSGAKRITMRHPGPHAQLIVAFRAPSLRDPDFPALVLFDALLAGGRGFAGGVLRSAGHGGPYPKASGTVLDQATAGLASNVRSDWQASTYPYVYTLSANVPKADGLAPVEAALFRALETAAARAWTEADLSRAVHQMRTALALDLDDQRGRVHQIALFEVAGGHVALETLPERVARVTLEEVRRFARERLGPDRATVGWFEPGETAVELARPSEATALPKPEAQSPARPPEPTRLTKATASARSTFRVTSGLTIAVEEQAGSSLASLHGRIEVGSAHDGGIPGLAALAATALSEPPADETADAPTLTWTPRHDPVAAVNLHAIEVTASVLPEDLPKAFGALARRLRRPPASGRAFEDLRAAALKHAHEQDASAEGQLLARALSELFPASSAMSRPPWADATSLARLNAETFAAFWRREITPVHTRLAIAGNVTPYDVRAAVETAFRASPGTASAARAAQPLPRGAEAWKEVRLSVPDLLQDELLVVWPGDRSRLSDAAATEALVYLLGETGYAGRLADVLVDPGLVYSVEASLEGEGSSSWLAVRTACDAKDTDEVLRRIRTTLEGAAKGTFTEAELREALACLRGKAARRRDGSASAATALLHETSAPTPGELTLAALNDTARRLFARGFPIALRAGRQVEALLRVGASVPRQSRSGDQGATPEGLTASTSR